MQSRSETWRKLAATGSFRLETAAEIGGVQYASISAPQINRGLMSSALSVGNCVSATAQFAILTDDTIPESAEIRLVQRLTDDVLYSEFLPAGTFYISHRTEDRVTGLLTLQCYDAMLKANYAYPAASEDESAFPKPMIDCVKEIAAWIGVEVDERTWPYIRTGPDYMVPLPVGLSMTKVLGYIGGAMGGNWMITPANRLRFVPLRSGRDADAAPDEDRVDIIGITGKINIGESCVVSRVSIGNGKETYTAGDDTGVTIKIPANPYASQALAVDLLERLGGLVYQPYTLEKAIYDPAAEPGDYVISKNDVRSVLYLETANCNLAFRSNISAPFKGEVEDEYPYPGTAEQIEELEGEIRDLVTVVADKASVSDLSAVYALIENLSVSDIKTGIIHSNDYQYEPYPRVYPGKKLYPSSTLYPSNGEYVLRGFAIDFSTGTIRGAFYSEQILTLQRQVEHQNQIIAALTAELNTVMDLVKHPWIFPGTQLYPGTKSYPRSAMCCTAHCPARLLSEH